MTTSKLIMKPLVLACAFALATSCSSGGDSGDNVSVTSISGTAEAPGGVIAQLEYNQSFTVAATNFMFPPVHAGITGLQPVTGATVELIRIDDDGNQVGDVLATASTSITGDYSLALPTGVSLAGNLIVRITGNGGASMSAMVVDQAVDINPISQYVLSKFVDDENLVLGDLALNEVVSLQGKVEEFDLSATSDLSTMLAALDAEVGELVDNEIATIASTPDDGTAATAVAGTWNIVEFDLGMHDNEAQNYGTFALDVYGESLTIAAGATAGVVDITGTGSSFIDAWTNFSIDDQGVANIYHETSVGGGDTETFTGKIDANGNITIQIPFEEDFESGPNPTYGWRWPSETIITRNTGNNNTMVFVGASAGVRYLMTDTNSDGVNDAVDPNAKDGDEVDMGMTMLLKQGSGMSNSSLAGNYGLVTLAGDVDLTPQGSYQSQVGLVNFSSGTATVGAGAFDKLSVLRQPTTFTNVTLTATPSTDGNFSFPYTVSPTGQVSLDTDNDVNTTDLEGYTNDDGSVVALLDLTTTGSPAITAVNQEMVVAVKVSGAAPTMDNAVFKFYPMIYSADDDGSSELITLRNISSLSFSADGSTATADFTIRGFERATDIASVQALVDEGDPATTYDVTVGSNGSITMSEATPPSGADSVMEGFVSADGKMMVLRFYNYETATLERHGLGMIVGIRQ